MMLFGAMAAGGFWENSNTFQVLSNGNIFRVLPENTASSEAEARSYPVGRTKPRHHALMPWRPLQAQKGIIIYNIGPCEWLIA